MDGKENLVMNIPAHLCITVKEMDNVPDQISVPVIKVCGKN